MDVCRELGTSVNELMGWRDACGDPLPATWTQFQVWELWLKIGKLTRLEWHLLRIAQRVLQANAGTQEDADSVKLEGQMIGPSLDLAEDTPLESAEQDEIMAAHQAAMEKARWLPAVGKGQAVEISKEEAERIAALPLEEAMRERRRIAAEKR